MKGSCLCGSVSYEVDALAGPIANCHCRTCRKAHAAPFAPTARVRREDFHWTGEADALGTFESTPGKQRHFCTRCGSHLMAHWLDRDHVILRVASLDDDPAQQVALHIWTDHDVNWLADAPEVRRYPEVPGAA